MMTRNHPIHYKNFAGTLVREDGKLSWKCPDCKATGRSKLVLKKCPECKNKRRRSDAL